MVVVMVVGYGGLSRWFVMVVVCHLHVIHVSDASHIISVYVFDGYSGVIWVYFKPLIFQGVAKLPLLEQG